MTQVGQETNITISGANYRLSKFTIPLYQEFITWARAQLPDPFEGLAEKCKGLSPELAKYLIDKAEKRAATRNSLADPEIEAVANSLPGVKKILTLLFRKYQPSLSDEQVSDIIDVGIYEHGADFFTQSLSGPKDSSTPTQSI